MTQIRYVIAAAEHLNFTKAASACNVTQPALTKGIRALEDELGTPLFSREGRRILLTKFGKSMLPHLCDISEHAETTKALARDYRLLNKAPIRLGVVSTLGYLRLAQFLSEFYRAHQSVEIALTEAPQTQLVAQLDRGEIDAAILSKTEEIARDYNVHTLYTERYVVTFPPGHRLAQTNAVPLRELSGENYVDRLSCELRDMVLAVLDAERIELYARFRSEREDWVQAMVHAGIGFAFMPEYSVTLPGLVQPPLVEPSLAREVSLVTVPGRKHPPAFNAMARRLHTFPWPD
ncbi:LysR family transcriptional regulator [Ovoidimarina sediminis]|uniref:LysR family transcriptional regulator n=1 Tax=Ovoidimarina sediminis TaxID=3079856 RepID=UPI0029114B4A|nr:LysR family transcriptional regulator [Rhodophyticola sp. MJ-SS7]MDU8943109.1 LysR family transcriptional regulator [Rhodophyticola sp. MJ-SS7]